MEVEYTSGMELAVKVIFGEDFGLVYHPTLLDTSEDEETQRRTETIHRARKKRNIPAYLRDTGEDES